MNRFKVKCWAVWVVGLIFTFTIQAQEIGPANGSLVIVGGALKDQTILKRFLDLAGGADVPIVVIPTAGGRDHYDQYWRGLRQFKAAGATNLTLLHTYDPKVADTDKFARPINEARGVWFSGGRQWRLVDSYFNTKVHAALRALLDRGGVIGGSSAGPPSRVLTWPEATLKPIQL